MLLRVVRYPHEHRSPHDLRFLSELFAESPSLAEREHALPIPINVKEQSSSYELIAEVPGVAKEDLTISIESRTVTIKGVRKPLAKGGSAKLIHSEIPVGRFARSFVVPKDVDTGKLEARLSDGVLRLTMPKAEQSLPREIAVR